MRKPRPPELRLHPGQLLPLPPLVWKREHQRQLAMITQADHRWAARRQLQEVEIYRQLERGAPEAHRLHQLRVEHARTQRREARITDKLRRKQAVVDLAQQRIADKLQRKQEAAELVQRKKDDAAAKARAEAEAWAQTRARIVAKANIIIAAAITAATKAGIAATKVGMAMPLVGKLLRKAPKGATHDGASSAIAPNPTLPPHIPDRNWGWFLDKVIEARQDRQDVPMTKLQAWFLPKATLRHRNRWVGMVGGTAGVAGMLKTIAITVGIFLGVLVPLIPAEQTHWTIDILASLGFAAAAGWAMWLQMCMDEAFLRCLVVERMDFVEPHIPTGLLEIYVPKAAVADQMDKWHTAASRPAFSDPNAYMWLALPEGQRIAEVLHLGHILDPEGKGDTLDTDGHRMEDSLNIERRAADRLIYQAGLLQSRVDKASEPKPHWIEQYWMEMASVGLVVLGVMALIFGGG